MNMSIKSMNRLVVFAIASVLFVITAVIWRSPRNLMGFLFLPMLAVFLFSVSLSYFRLIRQIVAMEQDTVQPPSKNGLSTSSSFAIFAVFALAAVAVSFCAGAGFTSIPANHSHVVMRTALPQ